MSSTGPKPGLPSASASTTQPRPTTSEAGSATQTQLVGVKAPHGARVIELKWGDGRDFKLPHRIVRGYCPCAGCQGHGGGVRFVDAGDPELRDIGQVGNYALELGWGDGHATGIYPYPFLRRLGELYASYGDALPEKMPELR